MMYWLINTLAFTLEMTSVRHPAFTDEEVTKYQKRKTNQDNDDASLINSKPEDA